MSITDLDTHELTRAWSPLLRRARGTCSCGQTFAVYVHDFPTAVAGQVYALGRVNELHHEHSEAAAYECGPGRPCPERAHDHWPGL